MIVYLACWSVACAVAAVLLVLERRRVVLFQRDYFRLLFQPWKLASFAVAAGGLTLLAPWTGDPTWDHTDALFMAITTFLTAPWALGVIYRRTNARQIYCAAIVWLFSASWSYDLYIYLRDGVYPATWAANIAASSVLYVSAGLLWSLERRDRFTLAFLDPNWPRIPPTPFRRIAWLALVIMLLVALSFLPFFLGR